MIERYTTPKGFAQYPHLKEPDMKFNPEGVFSVTMRFEGMTDELKKLIEKLEAIQDKAFATPNIHFMWESIVVEVGGDELLSTIIVKNVKTGELTTLHADLSDGFFGLFGFLGLLPNTELLAGSLDLDAKGYVKTDENMHTNIPGVFAAGDLRTKVLRQVVTAAADGAIAANEAKHYLADL